MTPQTPQDQGGRVKSVTIQFEVDATLYPGNGWQSVATAIADAVPIVIPDDRDPGSEGACVEEVRWELKGSSR